MGPNGREISKCYSSYKLQPKVFQLVLNFSPNGPHKSTFVIFEILTMVFRKSTINFPIVGY